MGRVRGLDPIVGSRPAVLILGTLPSTESMRCNEYYANPRNCFWKLMASLFMTDAVIETDYEELLDIVRRSGLAIWDVVCEAERVGSSDSDIVRSSVVPNDIASFLAEHSSITAICFNGGAALELFDEHVAPSLPIHELRALELLPSTSPLNTHMTVAEKLEKWCVVAELAGTRGSI